MPAVGGVQITGGLQMFGDQRCVLVHRLRMALLDRGGQPPVQLAAIGFELGFVGHRADQRMPECVFSTRSEPDLINQFGFHQLVENGINSQHCQQRGCKTQSDHRRGVDCLSWHRRPHQRQPRHRITLGSGTGVSGRCAVVAGQSGMARGLGLLRGFSPTHRPGNSRLSRGLEVWDSYSERRPARRRQRAAGDR